MNKSSLNTNDANTRISRMTSKNIRATSRFRIRPFVVFALNFLAILALIASPISTVRAQAGSSVTASAVIVPAQVAELGFLNTAIIREVNVHQGDAVKAGEPLASLNTPELEYAVTAAEASYRSAQSYADLQRYRTVQKYDRRGHKYLVTEPREVVQKGDALAARAQASLEIAQATLAQSTLLAPFDADVVKVHVVPGELVQLDQTVVTLATLDNLQIETTDLSERDIARIQVGQTATVFVDALGAEFSAHVIAIAPRAETLGGDVIYKVTLAFDEQPVGLLWGMTAEVTISAE